MIKKLIRGLLLKGILIGGACLLNAYIFFRVQFINFIPLLTPLSIILFVAELHTIFHLYGLFYALWPRKYQVFKKINTNQNLVINIFICVCGEPASLVRKTIVAAKEAVSVYISKVQPYEYPTITVLNDGFAAKNLYWKEIEEISNALGVRHIARENNKGFKAGNINHGLSSTPTNDPHNTIDMVLDSDFSVEKNALVEIAKPFVDNAIDFVQTPQRYENEKSWIAKAAAAHQIFFFEYICPSKGYDNALFLCGTNFAIRRKALKDVRGFDMRFITEDYATSLNLHLIGKKGVFIPKVLARGIAPSTLKAYFNQQRRWSKGSFDVSFAYLRKILFGSLTLKQKFHYLLSATYYLIGLRDLILILAPIPYLLTGASLIKPNNIHYLLFIYLPLLLYNFVMYVLLFKHPIKSLVLDIISFPVFTTSFFSSILKKNLSFIVTIKHYHKENPFTVYRLQLLVAVLLFIGLFFSMYIRKNTGFGTLVNYFWATYDAVFLAFGFFLILHENYGVNIFANRLNKLRRLFIVRPTIYRFSLATIASVLIICSVGIPNLFAENSTKMANAVVPWSQELLVPNQGVYYGYYFPHLNIHPKSTKTSLLRDERPSLVMFYQDWNNQDFNSSFVEQLSQQGAVPIITWEPWDSKKIDDKEYNQNLYSLKRIASGKYDDYLRKWAKAIKRYDKPLFIRLAHEMNGNWYPWGNNNTPEDYIAMWQHVFSIFEQEGAKNALWVWAPNNTDEYGRTESLLDYYPGDKYVDWVGFSGFNWGTSSSLTRWYSFREIAADAYAQLSKLNKPIMVAETSSVTSGGDRIAWIKKTMIEDIPSFPKIKAVVLFDANFHNADFKLSEDKQSLRILSETILVNRYYLKQPLLLVRNE